MTSSSTMPTVCSWETLGPHYLVKWVLSLYIYNIYIYIGFFPLQVWRALLKEMPIASVLRALGKMTADKVLEPGGSDLATVCERIQSEAVLKKVRHTAIFLKISILPGVTMF